MQFRFTNASVAFMGLIKQCSEYLDFSVIVFLIYSSSRVKHEKHLILVIEILKRERP